MNRNFLIAVALLGLPVLARATPTYTVSVNTSSVAGVNGSIDFQLNPANSTSPAADVSISNFSGGIFTSSAQSFTAGGVTGGPIPSPISIANSQADNEVLDTLKFGSTLTFNLNFSGPAITSPTGGTTAGSIFTFFIYSDPAGTVPALTSDPNGVAYDISINDNGTLTSTIVSPDLQASATPEPASAGLLGGALSLLAGCIFFRRRFAKQA